MTLQLDDGRQIRLEGTAVTIGGEARCTVSFPNDARVRPRHAQLKRVGERWLIEAEAGGAVQVGEAAPARVNWLLPGDEIRLTPSGPTLIFNPAPRTDRAGMESAAPLPTVGIGYEPVKDGPAEEPTTPRQSSCSEPDAARLSPVPIELLKNLGPLWLGGLGIGAVVLMAMFLFPSRRPPTQKPVSSDISATATIPVANESPIARLQNSSSEDVAKLAQPASVLPPLTWDEIVRTNEGAIVCIALEYKGYTFPFATGWVAHANRIVTTASVAVELESVAQDGFRVVIHHKGQMVPIRSVRRHQRYDAAKPTELTSQRFNIGWLIPESDLVRECTNATDEDWKSLALDSSLLSLGIVSSLGENEPYDPLKVKTMRLLVRMTGSDPLPDEAIPLYRVTIDLPKTAEGSPVFNNRGRIIGVLAPVGSAITMVPTSGMNLLLD